MLRFEEQLLAAKEAIKGSGYTAEEEAQRLERVDQEYSFVKYIEINYYKAFYSEEEYNAIANEIKEKFAEWGVVNSAENIPLT